MEKDENNYTRIKTYDDACYALGVDSERSFDGLEKDEIAYIKLKIIVKALNGGWKPEKDVVYGYGIWGAFRHSGYLTAYTTYRYKDAGRYISSRLCFKNEEIAEYAGRQFDYLFVDFLTGD